MHKNKLKIYISILTTIILTGCGSDYSESSDSSYPNNSIELSEESSDDDQQRQNGSYDCDVTNTSRGNGPYALDCDKDGDEVTINFNNGGSVTIDSDGYDSSTGEQWDVELQ